MNRETYPETVSLLVVIDRFLRATGMPWSRLGRIALGDPRFVGDLRNGRNPRKATRARIIAFVAEWGGRQYVRKRGGPSR